MEPIILASSSPRRQEILRNLNIPFQIVIPDFTEETPEPLPPAETAEYFAVKKVETVVRMLSPARAVQWVLGADTLIVFEGRIYGKPKDRNEAKLFLRAFSGKTHQVITAIAFYNGRSSHLSTRVSVNDITFSPMSDSEIEAYLSTGEWQGVAGGYRIQGIGACFIPRIEGSYSSAVGLPISELYDILCEHGYPFPG